MPEDPSAVVASIEAERAAAIEGIDRGIRSMERGEGVSVNDAFEEVVRRVEQERA